MKTKHIIISATLLVVSSAVTVAVAQGMAFTYQGRLNDSSGPYTGNAEFQPTLWDAVSAGSKVADNSPSQVVVAVTNGLFILPLDFGDNFPGADRWLQLEVRTAIGPFTTLSPRQALTPTPYALTASTLSGTLSSANLGGTYSSAVTLDNAANNFTGSGAGLTGLNASQLTSGTVPNARLSPTVSLLGQSVESGEITDGTIVTADIDRIDADKIVGGDLLVGRLKAGTNHMLTGAWATIAGGSNNTATALCAAIGGGTLNTNSGQYASIGGGYNNRAGNNYATVAGGYDNVASGDMSFIGSGDGNQATGSAAVIGGGRNNVASGSRAVVGGGYANRATNSYTVCAGGYGNNADGYESAIGGGDSNWTTGSYSTIPGGYLNLASRGYTFAAGYRAKATNQGAFVWGDSTNADVTSTNNDSVTFRAAGGYRLFSNSGLTAGVYLAPGGGSWTSMSDRNAKEGFQPVNSLEVLHKVAALPMATWNYKSQDASVRHIGPMAQDFKAAFGVGESDTGITSVDADGVALAAIQGLNEVVKERDARITQLEKGMDELKAVVKTLAAKVNGGVQ